MKNFQPKTITVACLMLAWLAHASFASGYSVTSLQAICKSGQVFLTWTNPSSTNLKYYIYRSTSKITSSNQLTSATYLGYVRDNSAKNMRKSNLENKSYYFIIDPSKGPLATTQGLYVATCTDNKKYYYAVTVVTISNNQEDKTIVPGSNSLIKGVSESIADPQPVLQLTQTESDGAIHYEYVQWGNNQNASHYPAFNNCGSYGYNFSIFKRGSSNGNELFVLMKDDNPFSDQGTVLCNDCSVLKPDDWLPNGSGTYWIGYNDGYDIYSTTNPVFTTGTIKTYTQARVGETLQWVRKNLNVDSDKVFITGTSHNGFGAMFTGQLNTNQITVVYGVVPPPLIKAENGSSWEHVWCDNSVSLPTDVIDTRTNEPIPVWQLFDNRFMDRLHYDLYIPYMGGVNGKNDVTVGWVQIFHWYDSLNSTRAGGTWYWDQRDHKGNGSQFTPDETKPDYSRFAISKSFPAFAYCSINQNPGDGDPKNGDPYGAINGYLDWDDGSVQDQPCNYAITCFVKDFYVGGKLDKNQYDSCTSDLTLRRVQNFNPAIGSKINWTVKNNSGKKVQSGSFRYNGGAITLYGVKIYKTNSKISLTISGCTSQKSSDEDERVTTNLKVVPIVGGYELVMNLSTDDAIQLKIFDLEGRLIQTKHFHFSSGLNSIPVGLLNNGLYIAIVQGKNLMEAVKLNFMK